jgi:putative ABC transport system permease protein
MRIELPVSVYTAPERIASFYEEAVRRVRSLPGVQAAATINELPVQNYGYNSDVEVEGLPPHSASFFAEDRWITGDYFSAMRIPIVRGRGFLPEEMAGRIRAVIINQTMARQLWKDRNPIGYRLRYTNKDWFTVVGVMRDVRQSGLEQPARAEVVAPLATFGEPLTEQSLVIRSALPEADIVARVRHELAGIEPEAALDLIKPMDEVIRDSIANHRITAALLITFAGLALLLAAFGIYGVVSYTVAERRRDFAVRLALGAHPALLVRLVFRESMAVIGLGLALGLAGVFWVSRMLEGLLYGTSGLDARIIGAVVPTLAAVAALAVLIPAIRVVRLDPMSPLRES